MATAIGSTTQFVARAYGEEVLKWANDIHKLADQAELRGEEDEAKMLREFSRQIATPALRLSAGKDPQNCPTCGGSK